MLDDPGASEDVRDQLYEEYGVSRPGRIFATRLLPVIENQMDTPGEFSTATEHEVLAEVALWRAFRDEPKFRPLAILLVLIGFYDALHPLPVEVYGILLVGYATLSGLVGGLRGRTLIAAEHAGVEGEDGIPADVVVRATAVANSTVSLVFIGVGIVVQLLATSQVLGTELLSENYLAGRWPPLGTVLFVSLLLWALGYIRR